MILKQHRHLHRLACIVFALLIAEGGKLGWNQCQMWDIHILVEWCSKLYFCVIWRKVKFLFFSVSLALEIVDEKKLVSYLPLLAFKKTICHLLTKASTLYTRQLHVKCGWIEKHVNWANHLKKSGIQNIKMEEEASHWWIQTKIQIKIQIPQPTHKKI